MLERLLQSFFVRFVSTPIDNVHVTETAYKIHKIFLPDATGFY